MTLEPQDWLPEWMQSLTGHDLMQYRDRFQAPELYDRLPSFLTTPPPNMRAVWMQTGKMTVLLTLLHRLLVHPRWSTSSSTRPARPASPLPASASQMESWQYEFGQAYEQTWNRRKMALWKHDYPLYAWEERSFFAGERSSVGFIRSLSWKALRGFDWMQQDAPLLQRLSQQTSGWKSSVWGTSPAIKKEKSPDPLIGVVQESHSSYESREGMETFLGRMKQLFQHQWIEPTFVFSIEPLMTHWPLLQRWQFYLLMVIGQLHYPCLSTSSSCLYELLEYPLLVESMHSPMEMEKEEGGDDWEAESASMRTSKRKHIEDRGDTNPYWASWIRQAVPSWSDDFGCGWQETDTWRKWREVHWDQWSLHESHTRPLHGVEKVFIADPFPLTLVWILNFLKPFLERYNIGYVVAAKEYTFGLLSYEEAYRLCLICPAWAPPLSRDTGHPAPIDAFLQTLFDPDDWNAHWVESREKKGSETNPSALPRAYSGSLPPRRMRWQSPSGTSHANMARDTIQYSQEVQLLLTTYECSAYGINLTQLRNGILFGLDRVAAHVLQMSHRMLRLNQSLDVYMYTLESIGRNGMPTAEHIQTHLVQQRLQMHARWIDTQTRTARPSSDSDSGKHSKQVASSLEMEDDLVRFFRHLISSSSSSMQS